MAYVMLPAQLCSVGTEILICQTMRTSVACPYLPNSKWDQQPRVSMRWC